MKMSPNKTQSMIVSRSRTLQLQHPDLFIDNVSLTTSDSFKILGVTFDSKFTIGSHLRSVASVIAMKLGFLRKSYKIFWRSMCLKCFNSFILSCFKYWSPVFSFFFFAAAADYTLNMLMETWMLVSLEFLSLILNCGTVDE